MPPRKTAATQDKPFTFKARAGVITIPAKEDYDPSMEAIRELHAATTEMRALQADTKASDEDLGLAQMRVSIATESVLLSGFTPETAKKIRLSTTEVTPFMEAYQKHAGISIPK